ncbi:hypothetical protein K9U40_22855, partial [Xanthobacter autotrophicus]|nr:hypothetical protein [Xanthobacter autotrophicus]
RSRPIGCSWQVMSPGRRPARSSCGIDIQPTADLGDPGAFDYIAVVTGWEGRSCDREQSEPSPASGSRE